MRTASFTARTAAPLHELNWDTFVPVQIKVFIWIPRHRRTRTRARLCPLVILHSSDCPFCPGAAFLKKTSLDRFENSFVKTEVSPVY
jgi:hypothetical protein